ncbi:Polyketide biosynthesis cytochrome P450 PksS [Streptomyces sp. enrichment culture]|uniref:cytochrome P450 n=1 Tax=Streptomyces sp. enrichment culture TaxID=1795815 RepID=UPI003F566C36
MATPLTLTPVGEQWPERTPGPEHIYPLHGPDFARDPFSYYDNLRRHVGAVVPVSLEETHRIRGYLVIDHAAQLEILRDQRQIWSRDPRWYRDLAEGVLPAEHPITAQLVHRRGRLCSDGAEHARLSGPGIKALARMDTLRVGDLVEELADQLIDSFFQGTDPETETVEVDILRQFALPLPLLVLTRLTGMDEREALTSGTAVHEMFSGPAGAQQALEELATLMAGLVEHKRQEPGPDLVSWMLHHNQDGALTPAELTEDIWLQIAVGRGASTAWICNTLLELMTNERLNEDVAAARCSMDQAMNHVMWIDAPIQNLIGRWATEPTWLGGYRLNAGDMAIIGLGAAAADPAMRSVGLDTSRTNNAHLAWGSGTHGCPAPARELGALIVRTGLERLWDRLPDMQLAVPREALEWSLPHVERTPNALPVRFPRPSADLPNGAAEEWTLTSGPSETAPAARPEQQHSPFTSPPPRTAAPTGKGGSAAQRGRLPLWRSPAAWWPKR